MYAWLPINIIGEAEDAHPRPERARARPLPVHPADADRERVAGPQLRVDAQPAGPRRLAHADQGRGGPAGQLPHVQGDRVVELPGRRLARARVALEGPDPAVPSGKGLDLTTVKPL